MATRRTCSAVRVGGGCSRASASVWRTRRKLRDDPAVGRYQVAVCPEVNRLGERVTTDAEQPGELRHGPTVRAVVPGHKDNATGEVAAGGRGSHGVSSTCRDSAAILTDWSSGHLSAFTSESKEKYTRDVKRVHAIEQGFEMTAKIWTLPGGGVVGR